MVTAPAAPAKKPLRAYMGYENVSGPQEGACLVFAHTARQARPLAANVVRGWTDCDYIDVRVKRLRGDCAHLRQKDEPHVIESPPACVRCEKWHSEPLNEDGLCDDCAEEIEDGDEW